MASLKGKHNKVKPQQECDVGKTIFFENLAIFQKMATDLNTEADFIMALSSHESGWLNHHNASLHNLFGLTHAGMSNLNFDSYKACAQYWVDHYKTYVTGRQTMDSFISGLRTLPYNDIDPDYDNKLKRQYQSILKWKGIAETGEIAFHYRADPRPMLDCTISWR